jgi:Tfp pilus assembly protein PilX
MQRAAALIARLARRLSGQAGFALVTALGMSVVLGITGTTAMFYSTTNYRSASSSKAGQRAFSLAEAGLNDAYATLYNASDPLMPGAVPQRSESVEDGTMTYSGTLDTATNTWTLTGTGRLPSPTGGADIVRTVRGRASIGSSTHGSANNAVWNYVYTDATSGCTTIGNSVTVNVPLYIRNDLCLQNSARFTGYALQVGGKLTISNSATVGLLGSNVHEAHIANGCTLNGGLLHLLCGVVDRVFADTVDRQPTGLTKPPVDLAQWYADAMPGPMHACTTGSFPGGFDTNTTMDRSRADVDMTPTFAYDCQVRAPDGTLVGQIAWNPATNLLTVLGTIFFDGNITFRNSVTAVYQGRATIYAAGKITIRNSSSLCGVVGCNDTWNSTQNLLAFVAGSSTDETGFIVENSSTFQGAIYVVNDYREENGSTVWGPIIAHQIFLQNSTLNHYVPLGILLGGMPQTNEEAVSITNEPGSWG